MKFNNWISPLLALCLSCQMKQEPLPALALKGGGVELAAPSQEMMLMEVPLDPKTSEPSEPARTESKSTQKIIRNADLKIRVKDHKESTDVIEKTINVFEGYISTSNIQNRYGAIETFMTVRIKSDKFDGLLNALLEKAIYVDQKNIRAEDVTTQFIDTEARLKTKKELEKRYMELLKQAKSVEDILKIEQQLGIVREEIESKEGTLKYLTDQVAYSTINLQFYEQIEGQATPEDGFFKKVFRGITEGWDLLLNAIVSLFYVWPFLILLILIILFARRRIRMKRKKSS